MTTKTYTFLFIFILATCMGCQDTTSSIAEAEVESQVLLTDFTANLWMPAAFTGEEIPKDELEFITEHSVDDQMKMTVLVQQARSWDAAHTEMQALLAESSELPDYIRKQRAAVFMLKAARTLDDITDDQREAIAEYAEILAEYRSPEAALMLESLQKLDGHWTDDQIQFAAARSLEGANLYLDKRYYCEECPAGKAASSTTHEAIQATTDAFVAELLSSVESLRMLAEG